MRPAVMRLVHGALGQLERVRGPVVAVHAVHLAALRRRELGRRRLDLVGDVLDLLAVVLVYVTRGMTWRRPSVETYSIRSAAVEVAAVDADEALGRAAADLHQQDGGRRRVLLVIGVLGLDEELVAGELLGPVAVLARVRERGAGCGRGRGSAGSRSSG